MYAPHTSTVEGCLEVSDFMLVRGMCCIGSSFLRFLARLEVEDGAAPPLATCEMELDTIPAAAAAAAVLALTTRVNWAPCTW